MNAAPSRLAWLADELARIDGEGLRRRRREAALLTGGRIEIDGRVLANFASNDYLGLATAPAVMDAAQRALDATGVGSGASALVSGRCPYHAELERKLADFEGQEDAVLFPTGYAANLGTIAALVRPDDVVFCDRLNHACLVDGCRLSGASFRVYRSDRLEDLDRHLAASEGRRRWIVTDGVFGMDGTVAPLADLCDIVDRRDATLIVDEAHGTGVLGEHGRGACERCGVEGRDVVRTGTLSKAVGALGGFVAGPKDLSDYLWHHAKTQMFSTALPPAVCAAATAAFHLMAEQPERRDRLEAMADRLRHRMRDAGLNVPGDAGIPIVPVLLGEPARAVAAGLELERRGFLVAAIRPPTVPRGTARLRITLSASHDERTVEALAGHLIEVCRS